MKGLVQIPVRIIVEMIDFFKANKNIETYPQHFKRVYIEYEHKHYIGARFLSQWFWLRPVDKKRAIIIAKNLYNDRNYPEDLIRHMDNISESDKKWHYANEYLSNYSRSNKQMLNSLIELGSELDVVHVDFETLRNISTVLRMIKHISNSKIPDYYYIVEEKIYD